MKTCPHCAESIQDEAKVCRYCQRALVPVASVGGKTTARGSKPAWLLLAPMGLYIAVWGGGSFAPAWVGFVLAWVAFGMALPRGVVLRWGGGLLLTIFLVMVLSVVYLIGITPASSRPGSGLAAINDAPRLELLSSRGYASSSAYMKVEGEVKNITNEPIDRIRAVVTWRTKAGELITTDEAMIEYRPLMPGQTSPFSTLSTKNPLMDTYGVAFAIGSRPIAMKDSRK